MSDTETGGLEKAADFRIRESTVNSGRAGKEAVPDTRISYEPTKEDLTAADEAAADAVKLILTLADKNSFRVADQFSFKFGAEGKTKDKRDLSLLDSSQLDELSKQAEGNISTLLRAREQLDHIRTGFNRTIKIGDETFVNDPSVKYKVETPKLRDAIAMIDNFVASERENSAKYRALVAAESLEK
ncbi:MAG: hypothetical protein V1716_05670 [Candidatus Uhrbacteria bacterium]